MDQQQNDNVFLKKQWFIKSNNGKIEQFYDINMKKVIGSGTYGSVVKANLKGSKRSRAVKVIPKSKVKNPERFKKEIDILRQLDHPNIIKLYETFEDQRNVYLVMELCEGGELFDRITEKGCFSEAEAHEIFLQIIQALNYCHTNGICHRDLKPENFLFLTKADDSPIKVIDFGLSTLFEEGAAKGQGPKVAMKTKAGTPYYISPEVLKGSYDESCDIWSAGVILYILLSGVPPFFGDSDPEILEAVQKGEYTFDIPEFKFVTDSAKDLITKMITKPEVRAKAGQVLNHKWMKEGNKHNKELQLNFNALKNFTSHNKLKKVALTFIASQLSEQEIAHLGKLFKQLDKNGDGVLTIDEIREGVAGIQDEQSQKDLINVMKSIDTDGNGTVNYTEFLAATMEKSLYMKEEKLYQAFKMLDLDGSGKIDKYELSQVLGRDKTISEKYWEGMINEVDKNGDGEIDYNEFIEMMDKLQLI